MIATDEDALICDFAEYYHIYEMRKMPLLYIATLAKGLRSDSRIMMALNGLRVDFKTVLLAHIADNTAINTWFKTKDGQENRNRPPSLLKALTQKEENHIGFECGDDFEKEWRKLTGE